MASGFTGGGAPNFYAAAGRSFATTTMNNNNLPQPPYRSQLSQIFLDPTSQIAQQRTIPSLVGKRTLSEFQSHQQQQNPALNGLFLRSVKPRMYQHTSPISTLSPIEFSATSMSPEVPSLSASSVLSQQRYGVPLLQQLRSQPINLGAGTTIHPTNPALQGVPFANSSFQNRIMAQDSDKKMMNRLQELEKQLLEDDNDDGEGDAVSVITNTNSEWCETIQSLIGTSSPKPISPSPTSSSSSSSSSSTSVVTSVSNCSKQAVKDAASAISEGKTDAAVEILTRLSQVSNSGGNSEQRLIEYMLQALKSRVNPGENPPPVSELYSKEHVASFQLLHEHSPCFKLGFMSANLAILDATLDQPNNHSFHVIDFDIGQGGQYVNLLLALSARLSGKPATVKITVVADNVGDERLKAAGDILSQVAEKAGIALHFNVVSQKLTDLSRESLGCEPDETLAVNFAFKLHRMPDESVSTENPRDELLRRVKGLAPRVVTLVEQEMNCNTAPFMVRVSEACAYYGALFDSIESTLPRENSERVKLEEGLGRKLANSVACEGRDRVERCEVFGKWRARMSMAGFELKPLSQSVAEKVRARLTSGNRVNPGFTVKEDNGGICFGWMGRTLTVASAWR